MISRQVQIERELRAEGFDVQLGRAPDRRVLDLACSRIAELEAEVERLERRRQDWLDSVHACLVAAGAPADIDEMEGVVRAAGDYPSDFVRQRFEKQEAEVKRLREALEEIVCDRGSNDWEADIGIQCVRCHSS
jgi:hypothetical protein